MPSEPPYRISELTFPASNDSIIGARPVTVRRRVTFGDCDPAGIVYTPRFADYLIGAYNWFIATLLDRAAPLTVETPMRALTLDFKRMLKVGDFFDMQCYVTDIRSRTFVLEVRGRICAGEDAFLGTLCPIAFDPSSGTAVALPSVLRARLEAYRVACDLADAPIS